MKIYSIVLRDGIEPLGSFAIMRLDSRKSKANLISDALEHLNRESSIDSSINGVKIIACESLLDPEHLIWVSSH